MPESPMCQFTRIKLTHADQIEVKKLTGIMIPIYASIAVILLAVTVVLHLPRSGDAIAVAKSSLPPVEQGQR
jgi:hypothetical protein